MASESNERRMIIAILLTSTLLTMLGIAGVLTGAYDLSMAPLPEDVRELSEVNEELSDAEVQLFEARVSNPYRRPMAAANVVVSALVLIGSFLLSWRRRLAQWWIKQAVAAKLIWIGAYTATLVSHVNLTFVPLPARAAERYAVGPHRQRGRPEHGQRSTARCGGLQSDATGHRRVHPLLRP